MAKCVCCTALNSITEAKRHPGFHSESMARILQKRWNDVPKRERQRYCALHSGTGTGRATGEFVLLAAKAKEERAQQQREIELRKVSTKELAENDSE